MFCSGFDWKSSGTTIDTSKSYQFIVPNIADKDSTLSEFKGTGLKLDISKGDMRFQFTVPTGSMKDQKIFQFKVSDKSTGKDLLVNGQSEFMATPTIPLEPTTTLVVHKSGQEWENIRSSYLGSGVTSQTSGTASSSSTSSETSPSTVKPTTTMAPTSTVKLVFSSRNVTEDDDVLIQEKRGAFTNINIPRKTFAMNLGFDILSTIQSLEVSAVGSGANTTYYLNGEKNLKIDAKVPPSAVIVHEKGFDWQKELSEIRKYLESPKTGYETTSQKKFKIHVRNEAGEDIRFQQKQDGSVSGSGPIVDVPKGVLASVDYVDKDDTGKLTFEAVSKKNTTTSYLLNGQKEFVVDEKNLSNAGEYVVVHKEGADWKTYLKEMNVSSTGTTTVGGNITTNTTTIGGGNTVLGGGSTGSTTLGGGSSSSTTLGGGSSTTGTTILGGGGGGSTGTTTVGGNSSTGTTTLGGGSTGATTLGGGSTGTTTYGGKTTTGTTTLGGNTATGTTTLGGNSSTGTTTLGGNITKGSTTLGGANNGMTTLGGGSTESTKLEGNSSTGTTTLGGNITTGSTTLEGGSMSTGGSSTMGSHNQTTGSSSTPTSSGTQIGVVGGSDGSQTVVTSGTPGKVTLYLSSVADEPSILMQKGAGKREIPKEDILTVTMTGVEFELTGKSKSGKALLLNGKSKWTFTPNDAPKVLVLHEEGQDWEQWRNTVVEFVGHNPGAVSKPGVTIMKQDKEGSSAAAAAQTLFGKLNFKNQAQKEVKIYEMSGIGEPTLLSPNYVSTFFVKSSHPTASFKAEDPSTHEEYLLNGKNIFKVDLSRSASTENDVVITTDASSAKRAPEKTSKFQRETVFLFFA